MTARGAGRMRAWRWLGLAAGSALLLGGCASASAARVPRATADTPCVKPPPAGDVLVGVALSGGGSRAALFGASGLEALAGLRTAAGDSVLERVQYVSSVSGGSIAAGTYVVTKPAREVRVLAPEGTLSPEYRAFFDKYRADLSQDIQSSLVWRQLASFRWVNSALAANTLAEILREKLLGEMSFQQLGQRQDRGDVPTLIVNTTLYNNGRRLAITTLPSDAFRYDFFDALKQSLARHGRSTDISPILEKRWNTLLPMTPLDLHIDPCHVGVASAATASASFPPLVGPITLRVGDEEQYWHAGDGGLYENQGIESLVFLFLNQLQEKRARRALIVAFDSSFPFAVGERMLGRRASPFTLLTFDFSRIPGIMEERAFTYQSLFFRSLQAEGVFPGPDTMQLVLLRHVDAEWQADLSDLPAACRAETPPLSTPTAVVERIAEIPTLLRVASECDRQLLATAAAKLVAKHRAQILQLLDTR